MFLTIQLDYCIIYTLLKYDQEKFVVFYKIVDFDSCKKIVFLNLHIMDLKKEFERFSHTFQVIIILAYFGGLRNVELMDLQIEKMVKKNDGMLVTHCRSKQRSDKKETKFQVPNDGPGNFAAVIVIYLN